MVVYLFGEAPTEHVSLLIGNTVHIVGVLRLTGDDPIPVALTGKVIYADNEKIITYDDKTNKYAAFAWSDIKKIRVPQ
jgi:hypothetical protein